MCLIKVGSLEFATGKLGSRLILVLGHTKCGAIYGATKTYLDAGGAGKKAGVWGPLARDARKAVSRIPERFR